MKQSCARSCVAGLFLLFFAALATGQTVKGSPQRTAGQVIDSTLNTVTLRAFSNWYPIASVCETLTAGGATRDTVEETATNTVAFNDGFTFPGTVADSVITCTLPSPPEAKTGVSPGSMAVTIAGHTSVANADTGTVDFELRLKDIDGAIVTDIAGAWDAAQSPGADSFDIVISVTLEVAKFKIGSAMIVDTVISPNGLYVLEIKRDFDDAGDTYNGDFNLDWIHISYDLDF